MDPLDSEFVKHVLKHRPDSVTARLAREVETLRTQILQWSSLVAEDMWPNRRQISEEDS